MKYLIFGTGKAARDFLRCWYNVYFNFAGNPILAFVDNDGKKAGTYYLDKPVIFPADIDKYDYDYIIICSSFEKEIKKQLVNDERCNPNRILSRAKARDIIYKYFDGECKLRTKKIAEIVAYDADAKEAMAENEWSLYFRETPVQIRFDELFSRDVSGFDYVFIRDIYGFEDFYIEHQPIASEKAFIKYLSEKLDIPSDRILTQSLKEQLVYGLDCEICLGNENEDKIFYVIRLCSLWSIVHQVRCVATLSDYAYSKGWIPVVDGLTVPNFYHEEGELGKINAWEKFFEQPDVWKMEDIQQSKHVILSSRYIAPASKTSFNLIKMKSKLKASVNDFCIRLVGKKVLGVHYRGTDYNNTRRWQCPKQPTIEQMIHVVEEKICEWNQVDGEEFDSIFLCTESDEAVLAFQQHFGDKVFFMEQERVLSSDITYLLEYQQKYFKSRYDMGKNYWVDIITLSKCHSIISCLCAGQLMADFLNESCYENDSPYVHKYYIHNGIQGVFD